jgi:hypothetical protein
MAGATPLQIGESAFQDNYSNAHLVSENFEAYSEGLQTSPFVMTNGTYIGTGSVDAAPWCTFAGADKCLDTQMTDGTFQALPAGTTMWTARVIFSSGPQTVLATVVGNSGILQVDIESDGGATDGEFLGFYDAQGLQSVSFHIVPNGNGVMNYGFDNVTTSASTPLGGGGTAAEPAPTLSEGVAALLAAAMSVVGVFAVRRRRVH